MIKLVQRLGFVAHCRYAQFMGHTLMGRYTIAEASKLVGISPQTLRRWEREGKIAPPHRLERTNERIYTDKDIQDISSFKNAIRPAA